MKITPIVRFMRKYRGKVGPNDYTCDYCRGVFHKAWTDAEAFAEAATMFPGMNPLNKAEAAQVCDTCWRKMGFS